MLFRIQPSSGSYEALQFVEEGRRRELERFSRVDIIYWEAYAEEERIVVVSNKTIPIQ
jgi:hypothetical protein